MFGNRTPYGILCLAALVLATGPAAAEADDLDAARQEIEAMSPERKQELHRRYEQFMALTPQERERIRRLHRQLDEDPRGRELRQTMHCYHAWLGTLPAVTRYELRDLEPAERVARIKEIREAAQRGMRQPTSEDLKAIRTWLDERVKELEERLKESLAKERAEQFARLSPEERRWMVMRTLFFQRWRPGGGPGPGFDFSELDELRDRLSPQSQAWLKGSPPDERSPADQRRILMAWIGRAVFVHRSGHRHDDGPPAALGEHLDRFVEQLPPEQRGELLRLPPDEMQQELLRLYFARRGGPEGQPGRREGPFGGPGPGIFRPGGMRRPEHGGGSGPQRPSAGPPSGRFRPGGPGPPSIPGPQPNRGPGAPPDSGPSSEPPRGPAPATPPDSGPPDSPSP
jgi:hypothetical protein